MDIRERHIGPITREAGDGGTTVTVDVGALVRRLLLFEHCTLESNHLREMPALVRTFGVDGLQTLLDSSALSIVCDSLTVGSVGQLADLRVTEARGGPLPLNSYRVVPISVAEREQYIHNALQIIHQIPGTNLRQQIKLKRRIAEKLSRYPVEVALSAKSGFQAALDRNDYSLRTAVSHELNSHHGVILPKQATLYVEDLGNDGDFRVVSNVAELAGLSDTEAHKVIERGLLGLASLEQRLEIMKHYDSLGGFRDAEIPIFASRLQFLADQLDPEVQEHRFERITTISGLPSLDTLAPDQKIDIEHLLKLRETEECRDMRRWLREIDSETDQEISEHFKSLQERIAKLTHTKTGQVIRFIAGNSLGLIPGVGVFAGPAYSIADSFIAEKLIGRPGPISFLGSSYPSIFIK
ncbi:hypothetical protein FNH09_18735 [Streptomyces adustus]|uniref:Uncharacterized protein n=1 Tax=Streptomyces adustus TaxID=1609272 RepID=A0A5N8VEF1_9ACTN|nr:hypothetical protein [Streptomyces adustus]MPY33226.1 hypothetical protein [Streptomyces adustus]